jgi:hypothetical protein
VKIDVWRLRVILVMLAATAWSLALSGCAAGGTQAGGAANSRAPSMAEIDADYDRQIGQMVRSGEHEDALRISEKLMTAGTARERLIGTYWKAVSLTHLGRLDTAWAILHVNRGRWGGVMRETSAETLRRALETKAPVACYDNTPQPEKGLSNRLESLEKRTTELQSEIERLQVENVRYEKLLRELDRLP